MRKNLLGSIMAVAAMGAFCLITPSPAAAQPPQGKAGKGKGGFGFGGPRRPRPKAGPMGKLPDGKPDMTGYWNSSNNGGAVFEIEAHMTPKSGVPPGKGEVVDPPDGMIPYQPWAAAKAEDNFAHHMDQEPELHCYPSGIPHQMNVQFGFEIQQPKGYVVLTWEFMHDYRIIPTDNRPHISPDIKLFQGDPVGHWEGDTLVVDTTNLNGRTWLDTVGNFHSDAEHVVERFTPVDANTIDYEATITDPKTYTAPWKIKGQLWRNEQKNYEQMEFACVEGNEDVKHYEDIKASK